MHQILTLSGVKKTFNVKGPFEVLQDITLEVKEGEFVCIVGPSGCGKSVLLYLVAGFLEKTSGELSMGGVPITKPGTDRMMVFQDYVLFPWKSVYENILFGLNKIGLNDDEKKDRAIKYMDLVGLTQFKDWHIHKLSGGMKQRVAIARALIVNSKILLMDEPFSALDPQQRKYLRKNLLDIWEKTKKTVLFVTHSVSEALYLADKIYVMSSRPSVIKKSYKIDLPRPRNSSDPRYLSLRAEIEKDMSQKFEQTSWDQMDNEMLDGLLKTATQTQ